MTADLMRKPNRIGKPDRARLLKGNLERNQEERMMGLLLAAMLYFAAVAVCIRIVS